MSFFCCLASFLLAVWFCIYTHAQLRILKFQDSVYQKAEVCAHTINEKRKSKRCAILLRRQVCACYVLLNSMFFAFIICVCFSFLSFVYVFHRNKQNAFEKQIESNKKKEEDITLQTSAGGKYI